MRIAPTSKPGPRSNIPEVPTQAGGHLPSWPRTSGLRSSLQTAEPGNGLILATNKSQVFQELDQGTEEFPKVQKAWGLQDARGPWCTLPWGIRVGLVPADKECSRTRPQGHTEPQRGPAPRNSSLLVSQTPYQGRCLTPSGQEQSPLDASRELAGISAQGTLA